MTDNEGVASAAFTPFAFVERSMSLVLRVVLVGIAVVAACGASRSSSAVEPDFNREVRPVLAKHCLKCHGPDEHGRQGGLRFDLRAAVLEPAESGATAIVPGRPDESELLRRVTSQDQADVMPPAHAKDPLSAAEIDVLRRWIAAGANYANHWAFEPVRRPPLPSVQQSAWPRNPIDRFVLARLEAAGLAPSPEADRYALVRRVYLDLIGLPPTPEEADEFVRDDDPQAYERLVDRLLASPHYGERWARRWLDLARYADTNGYEKDRERSIWPYRDWVIRALNDDLPFDRFTIEQIAGDMLPGATADQRIATGFHRNTMLNEEGGIDPLEFRFYAMTDRTATTGAVWLGLTLQCAQCHTHKFDPIPHAEYYRFLALLNNADEPEMAVPDQAVQAQRDEIEARIVDLEARLAEKYPPEVALQWHDVAADKLLAVRGPAGEVDDDGVIHFRPGETDEAVTTLVVDGDLLDVRAVRLELLSPPTKRDGAKKTPTKLSGTLGEISIARRPDGAKQAEPVRIVRAEAGERADDRETPRFDPALWKSFDGHAATGWTVTLAADGPTPTATFVLDAPNAEAAEPVRWIVTLRHPAGKAQAFDRLRLRLGTEVPSDRTPQQRSADLLARQFRTWLDEATPGAVAWRTVRPVGATSNLPLLTIRDDDSVVSHGDITKSDVYRVRLKGPFRDVRALRLEALTDAGLPGEGPGRIYYEGPIGDFFLSEFTARADGKPVKFARASESFSALPEVDPKNPKRLATRAREAIDGEPSSGWSIDGGQGRPQYAVFTLAEPLAEADEIDVEMLFERHYACGLGRFRLSVTDETPGLDAGQYPPPIEAALATAEDERSADQRAELLRYYLSIAPELAKPRGEIEQLRRRLPKLPTTLVMRERPADEPRPTFRHHRGEYLQPQEQVTPGTFSFLPPLPADVAADRPALARWLVDAKNPLTPRVTVNRHWAALFGRGLVRTLDDFGYQGASPTHPELLDWLAAEFVTPTDGGTPWSVKRLHRLIVTSAAYRQASRLTPELRDRDPENLLLARGPRFRLEAELIRDAALRVSGLLTTKIGGPSVFPPQPASVTEAAYGKYAWRTSSGDDRYRRSLYTFSKRTAPFAMYTNFDAPSGELCVARRETSNTPLQALNLLNDAMLLEAAEALGKRAAAESGDDRARLDRLFRRVLTRPPQADELTLLEDYLQTERRNLVSAEAAKSAAGRDDEPGDEAASPSTAETSAWTRTARALLNLDEAVTKN